MSGCSLQKKLDKALEDVAATKHLTAAEFKEQAMKEALALSEQSGTSTLSAKKAEFAALKTAVVFQQTSEVALT